MEARTLRNHVFHCFYIWDYFFRIYAIKHSRFDLNGSRSLILFIFLFRNGVFTLAWSGSRTGTWKNGLYGFNKNLSHCTWTGPGKNTWNLFRTWRMGLVPIFHILKMCPVMNTSVLPCPCSGAVWKALIKTIQPILPGPCAMWKVLHSTGPGPCPSPGSGPSQCEYTIRSFRIFWA